MANNRLEKLLTEISACTLCATHLPLGPRPVVRAQASARILIIGQAPGTRVHETGIPWNDRSGERLRDWLHLTPEQFYDASKIAIMPMGFCYPGVVTLGGGAGVATERSDGGKKLGGGAGPARRREAKSASAATGGGKKKSGGDKPPRPECAPQWHAPLRDHLQNIELTLLVGQYAQKHYLGTSRAKTLTETVARFANYLPQGYLPLPHPSWRTTGWQKKHEWFDKDLLPILRSRVSELL